MTSFIIRKLRRTDLERGFLETLDNLIPVGNLSLRRACEIFDELSNNPVYTIFVAEIDGKIVGATTLLVEQKFLCEGGRMAHIEDVATRQGFERQGIGRALQEAAIREAKSRGCFRIDLTCETHNIPFYEKCGFKVDEHAMKIRLIGEPPK